MRPAGDFFFIQLSNTRAILPGRTLEITCLFSFNLIPSAALYTLLFTVCFSLCVATIITISEVKINKFLDGI